MSVAQTVRNIIEASRYLVLATADTAGRPWSTPLYFAHIGFTEFFWVSSPDVTHSRNIAVRPEVGIVVFDSQAAIGAGQGVYVSAAHRFWTRDQSARLLMTAVPGGIEDYFGQINNASDGVERNRIGELYGIRVVPE
jgi:Pyridoxamine 5'-phosphate oxidase